MPARRAREAVESAHQLDLFDVAPADPDRAGAELLVAKDGLGLANADLEGFPTGPAKPSEPGDAGLHADGDRAVLKALEATLADARAWADDRPALIILASRLDEHDAPLTSPAAEGVSLWQARDDWLRRLETQQKSESTLVGYRVAINDLLDWSETNRRDILTEAAIVDYLHSYQERANRRKRATTGASFSCANSCAGSAGATASPTRSSISMRRPSPARSATG